MVEYILAGRQKIWLGKVDPKSNRITSFCNNPIRTEQIGNLVRKYYDLQDGQYRALNAGRTENFIVKDQQITFF